LDALFSRVGKLIDSNPSSQLQAGQSVPFKWTGITYSFGYLYTGNADGKDV
jgi:hypothetical protein